ncbi:phosphoethanolamine transferase [Mycoplana dimorpha]|uniref:Phosphatidylethanolamine:Kdo2-lipid A phosphoethanolamine transferase n=1 Tax=Mycoplana dimorpha TaxID=28320 RepID=A0A2T5BB81_MYCDI|nr:phosphoethanolamine--lipid A transferase [Mycoplana dimorpha]PTM96214.1 phosphatidylethanolamine:Kdo2-lipid A phosphoethanolamine transferase [Mycoplana dimorpha]
MAAHTESPIPAERRLRPAIGAIPLSIAVTLFVLCTANQSFWHKTAAYFSGTVGATAVFGVGLAALLSAVCIMMSVRFLTKPLFIFLLLTSAVASWFMDRFGVVVNVDMIRNAAETTQAEASNLITPAFVWHLVGFGLLPSLLVAWVRIDHRPFFAKARMNAAFVLPLLLVAAVAATMQMRLLASTSREHRDWLASLNPVGPIVSAIRYGASTGAEKDIAVQSLGADARVVAAAGRRPRVLVVVAGETARAENFSLGGYARPTNPELAARDVTYFPETTSCGTATAVSLPCMFSVYTRDSYTHRKGLETENLLDVLSHAGIAVEWWDNNTGSKRIADRVGYTFLPKSADPRFCREGECQDGILLDRLGPWLDGVTKDSVLVLHQLGSHGPAYFERYPDAYRRFKPDCRTAELADCTAEEIVNAYDNTIAFTDHVLSAIIDELQRRQDQLDASMIYMSDHGESLGEHGLYLHGAPYLIAPKQQTQVPFVLWLGGQDRAAIDRTCLQQRAGEPASHDNLFHTVLGLMSVATSVYERPLDVLSECRHAPSA